jgi:hypothetical protein
MRRWFAAALLAAGLGSAAPSAAQQAPLPSLALRYPTDSGKPMIFDPPTLTKEENDRLSGCAPGLQCRFRLLGVIQNNGAVELRGTAFTW